MQQRNASVVPPCPVCGFTMKWWFAKWKCFNCGQWNGCCGDSSSDPGGLWSEPGEHEVACSAELQDRLPTTEQSKRTGGGDGS